MKEAMPAIRRLRLTFSSTWILKYLLPIVFRVWHDPYLKNTMQRSSHLRMRRAWLDLRLCLLIDVSWPRHLPKLSSLRESITVKTASFSSWMTKLGSLSLRLSIVWWKTRSSVMLSDFLELRSSDLDGLLGRFFKNPRSFRWQGGARLPKVRQLLTIPTLWISQKTWSPRLATLHSSVSTTSPKVSKLRSAWRQNFSIRFFRQRCFYYDWSWWCIYGIQTDQKFWN